MNFDFDDIPLEITRKKIKNIYIRVLPPEGQVHVSAPLRMSDLAVRKFILSKLDWIRSHQNQMRTRPPRVVCTFSEGEERAVWGRLRRIRLFPVGGRRRIVLCGEYLDLHIPMSDSAAEREQLFEALLHRELEREIQRLLPLWCPVIGVPTPTFAIRHMRTRWGSCSPAVRRVRFSLQLAEKPVRFLEYVVVHELVHLLERSHNSRFRAYMDSFLPHWRAVQCELRTESA